MIALPVALVAKAGVVQSFAKKLGSIGGALGIRDTPTDKARKQEAQTLFNAALGGDVQAVGRLIANAFSGQRPKPVQNLAKEALREYVKAVGALPSQYQSYASKIGVPMLSPDALAEAVGANRSGPSDPLALRGVAGGLNVPLVIAAGVAVALVLTSRGRRKA